MEVIVLHGRYSWEVLEPLGGTDTGAIYLTKAGVPSGTIAVPCRYIHGPASVAHIDDMRNTTALAIEFVRAISMG